MVYSLCSFLESEKQMKKIHLPQNTVDLIVKFINEKRESDNLKTDFPNSLLRADVLDLLDRYCTVIYYPLENESNNGFHITGILDKNGNEKHFVYINTNQTIDKQIFTAAHELGHIWEVDNYVIENLGGNIGEFNNEDIINRFAAELLMPKDVFLAVFNSEHQKYKSPDGRTLLTDFLKIVATIMNQFLVPQKSVICRLFELEKINPETLDLLLGKGIISEDDITKYINDILKENGHEKFLTSFPKRHIDGLAKLLDDAEKEHAVSSSKIQNLRQTFNLPKKQENNDTFAEGIDVSASEEKN